MAHAFEDIQTTISDGLEDLFALVPDVSDGKKKRIILAIQNYICGDDDGVHIPINYGNGVDEVPNVLNNRIDELRESLARLHEEHPDPQFDDSVIICFDNMSALYNNNDNNNVMVQNGGRRSKSRKVYRSKSRKVYRSKSRKVHRSKSRKVHRSKSRKVHRSKSRKVNRSK